MNGLISFFVYKPIPFGIRADEERKTLRRLVENALAFHIKRTYVLSKTSRRFPVNAKVFPEGEKIIL